MASSLHPRRTTAPLLPRMLPALMLASGFGCALSQSPAPGLTLHSTRLMSELGHTSKITAMAFSPNDRYLVTGDDNGTMFLRESDNGRALLRYPTGGAWVARIGFSDDGQHVQFGLQDRNSPGGSTRFFAAQTGQEEIVDTPDGKNLLDLLDKERLKRETNYLLDERDEPTRSRSFDQRFAVRFAWSTGEDRKVLAVSVLDLKTGATRVVITPALLNTVNGSRGVWPATAISSDGNALIVAREGGAATMFQISEGVADPDHPKQLRSDAVALWTLAAGSQESSTTAFVGGNLMRLSSETTGDGSGTVRRQLKLSNLSEPKEAVSFELPADCELEPTRHQAVSLSVDGARVAATCRDGVLLLWEVVDPAHPRVLRMTPTGQFQTADGGAFSGNGKILVSAGGDGLYVWDAASGAPLGRIAIKGGDLPFASSFDGSLLAARCPAEFTTLCVYRAATGAIEHRFPIRSLSMNRDSAVVYAFSPDNGTLLMGTIHSGVWSWNLTTGKANAALRAGVQTINTLHYLKDGRRLLVAGERGRIAVWDSSILGSIPPRPRSLNLWDSTLQQSGDPLPLASIESPAAIIDRAYLSPDEKHLVLEKADATIELLSLASGKLEAAYASFGNGEWAVTDPAGHYDSSDPDTTRSLYWVTDNLRVIALPQMEREYYSPGLLQTALEGGHLRRVEDIAQVALPPLVTAGAFTDGKGSCEIHVQDDGGGIGKLRVKVNGRVIREEELQAHGSASGSSSVTIDLMHAPLITGRNEVLITAYDRLNRIESRELGLCVTQDWKACAGNDAVARDTRSNFVPFKIYDNSSPGNFYAIVIGIEKYADTRLKLTYPVTDARNIARALQIGAAELLGKDHETKIFLLTAPGDQPPPS